MSNQPWENDLAPMLRTLQIIVGSMAIGCTTFLVITFFVDMPKFEGNLITYIALAIAVSVVIARFFVPGMILSSARRRIVQGTWQQPVGYNPRWFSDEVLERGGDAPKLWQTFQTTLIVKAALLEGGAFTLLIAYMLESSPMSLIAAIVLILAILGHTPTHSRLVCWTESQLQLLENERRLSM